MSKYNAKKVVIQGINFDSKVESEYFLYLQQQKLKGNIKDFELQPEFELQPKFEKDGKKFLPIKYKADFKVIHNDDVVDIIDVKGMTTPVFNLKEKMYHYNHPYPLKLITYSKIDGGWIEHKELKEARKKRKEAKLKNNK